MCKVLNYYKITPLENTNSIYIGRGSIWGNPFVVGKDGTREECVAKYEQYLLTRSDLLLQLPVLTGKDLVCYCAPKLCHGDVLLKYANNQTLLKRLAMSDIYDMNGLFKLSSDDKSDTISFGGFNGNMNFTVFHSNGVKFDSVRVNQDFYMRILEAIRDTAKGVPGAKYPICCQKWNNSSRKRELVYMFTVGKDDNNMYYLEFKTVDGPPSKFPFIGDKNIEVGGNTTSDVERSQFAFDGFSHFVKTIWPTCPLFTRNNLVKSGKNSGGNNSKNSSFSPAPQAPVVGSDAGGDLY